MAMKSRRNLTAGLSKIEVLVIVAVDSFFICVTALWLVAGRPRARAICCNCNLKQIGLGMRVWASDHNGNNPMQISVTNGGTRELISAGQVFSTFQVMSNELSTPFVLVCPGDRTRLPATNFTSDFGEDKLSYFIGADATNDMVQAFLSGDRNLTINGSHLGHGIHAFTTNQSIGWTGEFHGDRGNIALGDGSVMILSSKDLNEFLANTGLPTNRLAIP